MPVLKNARRERFCQELAQGKTAQEAYKLAGFKDNRGNASTMFNSPEIQDRLNQIKSQTAKKTVITAEWLTDRLQRLAEKADECNQLSAAVSALDKVAKINGFGLDRAQINVKNEVTADPEALRRAVFEEYLARVPAQARKDEQDKLQ